MIVVRDPIAQLLKLAPGPLIRDLHADQKLVLGLKGRYRAIVAGRRSGKSYLFAVWLLGGNPGQVSLYCARTLKSAKAIMLPVFAELNARYGLDLTIRSAEGEIIEPNGHVIRLHGLNDRSKADLLLGQKFRRCAVDEGGAFDDVLLEYAITKVIQPTLIDQRGDFMLGGSPGLIPKGFFFDKSGDPRGKGTIGKWPSHCWDLRQNPHIKDADDVIREILETNGWTLEHPTFRREILSEWVDDAGSRIYNYRGERWAPVPQDGKTVIVVDFAGSDKPEADDTAFLVGRQPKRPHVFLCEGFKRHGINLAEIAAIIKTLKVKWGTSRVVVDAGALGAGYAKTLSESFGIKCEAADKRDKRARIELAVAGLDTHTLHVCEGAKDIVDEWLSLAWDALRRTHHESCADDLSDAMLYLVNVFNVVESPVAVITRLTEVDRMRESAMHRASVGRGATI